MTPLPGTIGLARIGGVVGALVWLGQAINGDLSKWTHAFLTLDDGTVFEAEPGGARITPLSAYDGHEVLWVPWTLTDAQRAAVVATARQHAGIGYNWTTYFYLAAYRLELPFLTKWLEGRVKNDARLICSQAVDHFYALNGIQLFDDGRLPYDVTPGDLARLVKR